MTTETTPRTFVQWKGTDVCMDFDCICGASGHIDGFFVYCVKCPKCGTVWELETQLRHYVAASPKQLLASDSA